MSLQITCFSTLRRLRAKNARADHTWRRQVTPGVTAVTPGVACTFTVTPGVTWRRQVWPARRKVTPGVAKSHLVAALDPAAVQIQVAAPTLSKPLSVEEKNNLLALRRLLNGAVKNNTSRLIATAFGVENKSIATWGKKVDQTRKKRSDAGASVINNAKKQQALFTPYHVFKKAKRRQLQQEGHVDT